MTMRRSRGAQGGLVPPRGLGRRSGVFGPPCARRLLALAAALALLTALALAGAAAAAQPIHRSNVLTARHVLVPGTHVRIVPPPGAAAAASFRGFEIASRRIRIRIEERMGAPFQRTEAELTASALEADGITLRDSSRVTLNGSPALLLYCTAGAGEGQAGSGLLIFAFGEGNLSSLIYASYPADDRAAVEMLRGSLLSAIFQAAPQPADAGGGYSISSEGTDLRFAGEASMVRYYTVGGKPVSGDLSDALYTSSQSARLVPDAERASFADDAMARYMANYEYTVADKRAVVYAGLPGFEIVADFKGVSRQVRTASGGRRRRTLPGKGYQVVLFDPNGAVYAFSGIAVRNAEGYLAQFRMITGTLRIVK